MIIQFCMPKFFFRLVISAWFDFNYFHVYSFDNIFWKIKKFQWKFIWWNCLGVIQGCQMVRIWPDCHDFRSLSGQVSGQEKIIEMSGFLAQEKFEVLILRATWKIIKRNTKNSMYKHWVNMTLPFMLILLTRSPI